MKLKSAEAILSASKPRDIFTMNLDTLEQEKEEYLEAFKPQKYNTIKLHGDPKCDFALSAGTK